MRRFFVGLAITAMLGIIPSQVRGNDRQISQAIVKSLQAEQKDNNLRGFNIDLEVDGGDVYLSGTVSSEEQEELALDIARRVDGVRQVYNELEVRESEPALERAPARSSSKVPGILSSLKKANPVSSRRAEAEVVVDDSEPAPRDSNAIATEVAQRIISRLKQEKAAGNLRGFSLDVEVEEGVAWLNGKVATAEQQDRVLQIVRNTSGVKQVVNGLTITHANQTPTDVAQQIVANLKEKKASGELKDFSVDVEVDNGIVWLTGYAASKSQQQIILDTARYIPGVVKVVNDLSIHGPSGRKAQQAGASSELTQARTQRPTPAIPQPLAIEEVAVGSAVANGASRSTGAPVRRHPGMANQAAAGTPSSSGGRPAVQYMWVPANQVAPASSQTPLAFAPAQSASHSGELASPDQPMPINASVPGMGIAPARFDHPQMPNYSWPSYAPYPNYGSVTYPKQYSPMAWPYIGPFYPYPQVPLGWRKAELKWKDGWWQLDFKDRH